MQKENPVIKNYILLSEKRVLEEKPLLEKTIFDVEISLYHLLLEQNKVVFYSSL